MAERVISTANLSYIENNLKTIYKNIENLDANVESVNGNVRTIYKDLAQLTDEFHDFVSKSERRHNITVAETRLVKVRQEIETKFGHYAEIRRAISGVLQADDLGIVRKNTITNVTEELMITTPQYWLAPCLVAVAAWINDQQDIAENAIREALKRNDEKTSLLFTLICRRANRKDAALKWAKRYFENQEEERLDRKSIILIDAYASGLLGADTEGLVSSKLAEWLEHLSSRPGFLEKQTEQWANAIYAKRVPIDADTYPYLRTHSATWPQLEDIMEGAYLHANLFNYLEDILEKEVNQGTVIQKLDIIMDSLVTDYDDEELPFREKETFNQYVIDFNGDEDRAQQKLDAEVTAFDTHKDFTQLLTDAVMTPEQSNASIAVQKLSIALSKDWLTTAYGDVVAKNRMQIPHEIDINIGSFNDKTTDGTNEEELVENLNRLIDKEKAEAIENVKITTSDYFKAVCGGILVVLGIVNLGIVGIVLLIFGGLLINGFFTTKKGLEDRKDAVKKDFENRRKAHLGILRAILAEVVDFRSEFGERDAECNKVFDYLNQIKPHQFIVKSADSTRRVNV